MDKLRIDIITPNRRACQWRTAISAIVESPQNHPGWAAPKKTDGTPDHDRALTGPDLIDSVNGHLIPHLKGFKARAASPDTIQYKIGETFGEVSNRSTSAYNLREALDQIDALRFGPKRNSTDSPTSTRPGSRFDFLQKAPWVHSTPKFPKIGLFRIRT